MSEKRFESPWERWSRDPRALSHLTSDALERAFVLYLERIASNDRLVPIDSVDYELPRELGPGGRAGAKVQIVQRLLAGTYHVLCGARLVRLHPVDLTANARSPRARRTADDEETVSPPAKTAGDLAFERDLGPIVDEDGSALPAAEEASADSDEHQPPDEENRRS